MSQVRDKRRAPFAWVSLEALRLVRTTIPASRQAGARNALLALAEAASVQRDGAHDGGYTLGDLAGMGTSERRLRPYLQDLAKLGLVEIEAVKDDAGRDLPTRYALRDGADESSDPGARTVAPVGQSGAKSSDEVSDPTRASDLGLQEEEGESHKDMCSPGPSSSEGNGPVQRIFDAWIKATGRTDRTVLDAKRRRLIEKALGTYPEPDVLDAVKGWRHSPHHCGQNDTGTVYNDLGVLLRDAGQLEKFRDLERTPPTPPVPLSAHRAQRSGGTPWTAADMLALGREMAS